MTSESDSTPSQVCTLAQRCTLHSSLSVPPLLTWFGRLYELQERVLVSAWLGRVWVAARRREGGLAGHHCAGQRQQDQEETLR